MRRNEQTLNFKKEISGRDWVLTRVFRLSILKSGEKVRGRLVDVPCLMLGGKLMYKIGIVLFGIADSVMTLTRQVYELNICFLVCLVEVYTWRGREVPIGRQGGR